MLLQQNMSANNPLVAGFFMANKFCLFATLLFISN